MGKWGGGEPTGVQSSLQQNVGHASGIDSLMEITQLNLWQSQVLAQVHNKRHNVILTRVLTTVNFACIEKIPCCIWTTETNA